MALPAITVLTGNNPHQRRYVFGYCINNCRYQLGVSPDWLSLALHLKRVALLLLIGEQRDGRVEISAVGSSDSNFLSLPQQCCLCPLPNLKSPASATKDARRNTVGRKLSAPTIAVGWT